MDEDVKNSASCYLNMRLSEYDVQGKVGGKARKDITRLDGGCWRSDSFDWSYDDFGHPHLRLSLKPHLGP